MSLSAGERLGAYQILSLLGAGGMGEVYRATDTKLGRDVAIKTLPADLAADPERLARLRREAKVLASLNHPHIAAIYGLEELDEQPFLVLELVEGDDLAQRLKRGAMPMDDALGVARQIAEALEDAHERGIVHRDLKPANVKLRPDGAVKVLDFGLAKAFSGDDEAGQPDLSHSPTLARSGTQAGVILGTAAYMSPEQARGRPVDRRADIWAFGVLLFEMLTGERLFVGETVSDTLAAVLKTDPDWTRLPRATPTRVRALLRRCLEKEPKRRLRDIGDARLELEDPGASEAAPSASVRHTNRTALWAGAALAAGSLATWAVVSRRPEPAPSQVVRLQVLPPDKLSFRQLAISPDGKRLAFTAADASGRSALWIRPLDSLSAKPVPDTTGASHPFWSPDSRFIGFFADDTLKRIEASGGPQQTICPIVKSWGGPRGGTWSRDGVILFGIEAFHSAPLYRVSAAGGQPRELKTVEPTAQGAHRHSPVFLPDGRQFLYRATGGQGDMGIYSASIDSEAARFVVKTEAPAAYLERGAGDATGHGRLLFLRDRTLLAQLYDPDRRELVGDPLAVAGFVRGVSVSRSGVFVHLGSGGGSADAGLPGGSQLEWLDRDGKTLGLLGEPGRNVDFRISPDGSRVAAQREDGVSADIWLFDVPRATVSRLTFGPAYHGAPVWSPDGTRIAFFATSGGPWSLYEKSLSGEQGEGLLLKATGDLVPNDWSLDGGCLIVTEIDATAQAHLQLLSLSATPEQQRVAIALSRSDENFARFSPDGRFFAYQSRESGRFQVYVRTLDRTGRAAGGRWQVSTSGGVEARWPHRGREIFYVSPDNMLMAVTVRTEPTFEAGAPRPLFPVLPAGVRRYDVMPDGQRFLVARPTEEPGAPATVVLGLFDQPLRKPPAE